MVDYLVVQISAFRTSNLWAKFKRRVCLIRALCLRHEAEAEAEADKCGLRVWECRQLSIYTTFCI